MQPITTKNDPTKRSGAWIPLIALALCVAIAAALLWLLRPAPPPARASRATPAGPSSYRNRAIFAPAPVGAAPREPLAVKGNVYSGDGELLAGATVIAATFDSAGNMPSPAGSIKTDAQGHFVLPLPEGTYQLNASMGGYGPSAITAQSGDTVSLVLPKSGVIQGHVRDERGNPVQRFTIDILSVVPGDAPAPPPAWSKSFDSKDGSYRADQIPAWPVMVRATAEDRAPGFSAPVTAHAGEKRDIDVTLTEGCTLTGTVVDTAGKPLSRVLVNAEERVSAGSAADPTLQTQAQAQSDDDGSFTLEHVPQATVLVRGYDGSYAVSSTTVEIGDCGKLAPVKLTMAMGGTITGVARRADGTPIPGARLSITDRSIGFVNTRSGADGHYRFDAIPAGNVRLELEHGGQRALRFVELKDGETLTKDVVLFAGGDGALRGRVTAGKKPVAGARLLVASNHGASEGIALYFPVTGEDGTYTVPKIPEGNYIVSVMSTTEGRGFQIKAGEPTTIDLDAGFVMPSGDGQPRARRAAATPPPTPPSP
jgi:hypothetical protein